MARCTARKGIGRCTAQPEPGGELCGSHALAAVIEERVEAGRTNAEITRELGVTLAQVGYARSKLGIPAPVVPKPKKQLHPTPLVQCSRDKPSGERCGIFVRPEVGVCHIHQLVDLKLKYGDEMRSATAAPKREPKREPKPEPTPEPEPDDEWVQSEPSDLEVYIRSRVDRALRYREPLPACVCDAPTFLGLSVNAPYTPSCTACRLPAWECSCAPGEGR